MSLEKRINDEIKIAMKAKDRPKLEALRSVKSAIILAKTEGGNTEITEEKEIAMLQKLVKQRSESADLYIQQNRPELADKEKFEATVIQAFLPVQLSNEELEAEIKQIIEQTGAESMKDMGKVMGIASKKLAGKAAGKDISDKVKSLLI